MHLFKFSFLCLFILQGTHAFNGNECLGANFQLNISHQGKPFGLSKVSLDIAKDGCKITLSQEKFKYLKKSWSIDVCREPVHIKKDGGSEVLKKKRKCTKSGDDEFCENKKLILTTIQDDALIFAEGEKEKIGTKHGKSYCAYLLIKQYLTDSIIFNRGQDYSKLFENGYTTTKKKEQLVSPKVEVPRPIVEGIENGSSAVEAPEMIDKVEEAAKGKDKGVGTY